MTRAKANRLRRRLMRGDFDPNLALILRHDPMFRLDPTGETATHAAGNTAHATHKH